MHNTSNLTPCQIVPFLKMKEMKTPEEVLLKSAPVFQLDIDDTLKNKCIAAMKEYAKQERSKAIDECIEALKVYGFAGHTKMMILENLKR